MFHEILLTMYKCYIIDNQILSPGAMIVEIGLVSGTQSMNKTQRTTNRYVKLNVMVYLDTI